jgi:hypothetical protein
MPNVFIKATKEGTIYIKVNSALLLTDTKAISTGNENLLDILQDNGYKVEKVNPSVWDYWIEYGLSYEINTYEELKEFKEVNIKANNIRDGKVQRKP